MQAMVWTILAAVLALNVTATVRIAGNPNIAAPMRRWQWLLVWLLPVGGAVVTLLARSVLDAESRNDQAPGKFDEDASDFMGYAQTTSTAEIADAAGGGDD